MSSLKALRVSKIAADQYRQLVYLIVHSLVIKVYLLLLWRFIHFAIHLSYI